MDILDVATMSPEQARRHARDLDLVDPLAEPSRQRQAAPRLATVVNTTVGLLDNRKGNADQLLTRIGELLVRDHGVVEVCETQKFVYSRRAEPEILADLRAKCDFVVTAVGD